MEVVILRWRKRLLPAGCESAARYAASPQSGLDGAGQRVVALLHVFAKHSLDLSPGRHDAASEKGRSFMLPKMANAGREVV